MSYALNSWGAYIVLIFGGFLFLMPSFSYLTSISGGLNFVSLLFVEGFGLLSFSWSYTSIICLTMLTICGWLSLQFSYHYTGLTSLGRLLFNLIFIFLLTMMILVSTGSLLFSLILWEYLGLVSFILMLYYSNSVSLRAAIITMMTSRIGDVAFFVLLGAVSLYSCYSSIFIALLMFLIVGSKSAFFPFISWLLEAMRAPTPVSALVHSSTLVAAGVWFGSCYKYILLGCSVSKNFILLCAFSTIFVTASSALIFSDLKKMVALSTSNKISWCLLFLLLGDLNLSLIQLLVHGVSKCLLFIFVGDIMSSTKSSQTYHKLYGVKPVWSLGGLSFLVICLSGLPFMGVFFSKHLFLSSCFNSVSLVFLISCGLGLLLTSAYSVRILLMCCRLLTSSPKGFMNKFYLSMLMMPLVSLMNQVLSFCISESCSLVKLTSFFMLSLQGGGILLGYFMHFLISKGTVFDKFWFANLWGLDVAMNYLQGCYLKLFHFAWLSMWRWDCYLANKLMGSMSFSGLYLGLSSAVILALLLWVMLMI